MLDGDRAGGKSQPGEAGERRGNTSELGKARGRKSSPLAESAEPAVTEPHGEDDPDRHTEKREQVVVAEQRARPAW
jgi:hypothetical protein